MSCEYSQLDGAYVLGSLAAAQRADYERHLSVCDECSRAVRELAGLPGLMGRVPLEVLEEPVELEPAPPTLLPAVMSEVRLVRWRRATTTAILTAAAVILVLGVAGLVFTMLNAGDSAPSARPDATASTAPAQRMESLVGGWATGWVSLTEREWGTQIDVTCTYGDDVTGEWTPYTARVSTSDGRVEQVGSWRAEWGQETHVIFATSAAPEDIETVEITTAEGRSVLRLAQ